MEKKIPRQYKYYCRFPELIENFYDAFTDNFKGWVCHHRFELEDSDGNPRAIRLTSQELKALGMYYHRPPEELIFMTNSDHRKLHNSEKLRVSNFRKTINSPDYVNAGRWVKGQTAWNKGTSMKDDSKQKIVDSLRSNTNSRQNRAKLLSKKWHENNEGLTWNQFQKAHRGDWR